MIRIEAGHDYRVGVWIKTDGCEDEGVSVTAVRLGGPGERDSKSIGGWLEGANPQFIHDNGASAALLATGGTHDWKKFEANIPADQLNGGTRVLFIYLRHDAQAEPRGKAYFDDLTVERLPKGTFKVAGQKAIWGVKNGGFELGARGWESSGNKGGGIVSENPAEGKQCLKITEGFVLQKIPVESGKRLRLRMKIKCVEAPAESVFVGLSYRGAGVNTGWQGSVQKSMGTNYSEPVTFMTGGTHEWKEVSVVVAPPANANELVLYLRKAGGEGVVYYDDVKIESTDDPETTAGELRRAGMAPPKPMMADTDFAGKELENPDFAQGTKGWVTNGLVETVSIGGPNGKG
nr:hypothetical protein [Verrucomicrobiota bacterium]